MWEKAMGGGVKVKKLLLICCLIINGCTVYIHDNDVCTIEKISKHKKYLYTYDVTCNNSYYIGGIRSNKEYKLGDTIIIQSSSYMNKEGKK
jgi:hypothetical protein